MSGFFSLQARRWTYLLLAAVLAVLYLARLHSYLLFHSLAELFSVVVAAGIFVVTWNSRRYFQNGVLLWLGLAYLFVAGMDMLHTLAYKGMGVFPNAGANLPTQLWLCARFLTAGAWLLAPLFLERPVNARASLAGFCAAFVSLVVWVFYLGSFPTAYAESEGRLTLFKIVSEYVISAALAATGYLLWRKRRYFDPDVLQLLLASIIAGIASEMAFTLYSSPYGTANLFGHYLKIVSCFWIYKAVIETGLTRPYSLLFRDLKRNEQALRKREWELQVMNEQLEARVAERTAEARKRSVQLRALASQITEAEQRERRRLAQILHDHLQQILVAARLHLSAGHSRFKDDRHENSWRQVDELLQQAIALSRSLTVELYPPILNESGLPAALEWLRSWSFEQHHLKVEVCADPAANPANETVRAFLFQAVRELLFNVVKHAGSSEVRLVLTAVGDNLEILVQDNGRGFDLTREGSRQGFGLYSIKERLEILGGSMTVYSEPGCGTSIHLTAPLK
ncbi:MAG: MASE3 domain-containing protein [Acidobacteriota bacterium]